MVFEDGSSVSASLEASWPSDTSTGIVIVVAESSAALARWRGRRGHHESLTEIAPGST